MKEKPRKVRGQRETSLIQIGESGEASLHRWLAWWGGSQAKFEGKVCPRQKLRDCQGLRSGKYLVWERLKDGPVWLESGLMLKRGRQGLDHAELVAHSKTSRFCYIVLGSQRRVISTDVAWSDSYFWKVILIIVGKWLGEKGRKEANRHLGMTRGTVACVRW